jgi:hypothetical protein
MPFFLAQITATTGFPENASRDENLAIKTGDQLAFNAAAGIKGIRFVQYAAQAHN